MFEKLAKSPQFAKVTLKTSNANKPKTKQEIQSPHQKAKADNKNKEANFKTNKRQNSIKTNRHRYHYISQSPPKKLHSTAQAKPPPINQNQPNPHQI